MGVFYTDSERRDIDYNLKKIYTILHSDGAESGIQYLNIDAMTIVLLDSKPFRRYEMLNDNFTYYYLKRTDASRVYVSNWGICYPLIIQFFSKSQYTNRRTYCGHTWRSIYKGIFASVYRWYSAKEYVKFNERSMIRLLGDMRAYNYVVVPTHDFDQVVYKIRPIDFDQQSFEGKLSVYRPQFFKENKPLMDLVRTKLNQDSITQYKIEERSIEARRIISSGNRLQRLIAIMQAETLTLNENLIRLRTEIYKFTKDRAFKESRSMGEIMQASLRFVYTMKK